MPRRADVPCAVCGELMWRGTTSLPPGKATCRHCRRRANPPPRRKVNQYRKRTPCADCSAPCVGSRCRTCRDIAQRIRAADDPYVQRWVRERAAPGLNQYRRKALLRRWIQQGRACAYCTSTATTIDHVLPLVRGGTNHEGNLTPCCKQCNSRKAGLTLIEWRTGKRLKAMTSPPPWMGRRKAKATKIMAIQGIQVELFKVCAVCGLAYQGRASQCSKRCADTYYRATHRPLTHHRQYPCMDCGEGAYPRVKRCDECRLTHKRIKKRAEKARARARRRLATAA